MRSQVELSAVMRKVFRIYVDEAAVLMPAAAVVFVITGIVTELIVATGSTGLELLSLLIDLLAGTLFTGMVVELVADVQDGRRDTNALQLLRAVSPVLGQLILVGVVTGLLEGIGFVLILVPGLILMTLWSVVAPVVVVENPGGLRALRRSRELVRGNALQVFSVIIVLVIGVYVASGLIDAAAASASSGVHIVIRVVVGILAAPISALAAAVLYFELRGPRRDLVPTFVSQSHVGVSEEPRSPGYTDGEGEEIMDAELVEGQDAEDDPGRLPAGEGPDPGKSD